MKNNKSLNRDVMKTIAAYGISAVFDKKGGHHKGERTLWTWRDVWQNIKAQVTKREARQILQYEQKHMQSDFYKNLNEEGDE